MLVPVRRHDSSSLLHGVFILLLLNFVAVPCRGQDCTCAQKIFDSDVNSGAIEDDTSGKWCSQRYCEFLVEPNRDKGLTLSIRYARLNDFNSVEIHQHFFANNTRVILPEYVRLKRNYEDPQSNPVFTAAQGVGFMVRSYLQPRQSQASFSFLFYRSAPDEGTCPFPLLHASESYNTITTIRASGDIGKVCPLRIISSTPGRKVYVAINALGSFFTPDVLRGGQQSVHRGSNTSFILSDNDGVDLLITKALPSTRPLDAKFKELTNDPCHCNSTTLVVGNEPVHVTSPGFPDFYCSKFKCSRKFLHENNTEDDTYLAFKATVHFLDTVPEKDFLKFSSDGYHLESLSGVHKNLTLVLSGYSMETNFLTDGPQTSYGYNMTVKSVRLPSECLCPHEKGFKSMLPEGTVLMNLPKYCTVFYCKWVIPAPKNYLQFAAIFNFTSKFDMLSVSSGDDTYWSAPLVGGKLAKRHWKMPPNPKPVTILFRRDVPEEHAGELRAESFRVSWRAVDNCKCHVKDQYMAIHGEWRELASPAYPAPYCDNLNCLYRIAAPARHQVLLNITDFHTESYSDVLTIYDGNSTNERTIGRFHGRKRFPSVIRSSGQAVTLLFKTDHDISFEGFEIMYSAAPNTVQGRKGAADEGSSEGLLPLSDDTNE
ncbi:hypothetical protein Y032_0104g3640 [Ancylostoma ceylanicum]|uniref:CUB domain-containing protein n=1 Tax=Ancylostoma ceylanicum TaxID=53326 RepID=A0A016TGQ0_9BILA|nr:hypothetical protein Y032_0104g3640 [Ancylostoma ceylanicum]